VFLFSLAQFALFIENPKHLIVGKRT